jgi:protein arginine phosphatase
MSHRVLLVCTGNTCRSPMAEAILKSLRPDWEVKSAGIMAETGTPASGHSRTTVAERRLSLDRHSSQPVREELIEWADEILVMGEGHRRALLGKYPRARDKTRLLKEAAGLSQPWDISDPVGQSLAVYQQCAEELEQALSAYSRR